MTRERSQIELGDVTQHNIKQLRLLNSVVFPVAYNDKFYKEVQEVGEFAKLAYFNDIMVGGVCSRPEPRDAGGKKLYIMTLGCLAPYRRLGIGSTMLTHILDECKKHDDIHEVYLHVQINNDEALNFYKKFGFDVRETKEDYYKRIEPAQAHVLVKDLHKEIRQK